MLHDSSWGRKWLCRCVSASGAAMIIYWSSPAAPVGCRTEVRQNWSHHWSHAQTSSQRAAGREGAFLKFHAQLLSHKKVFIFQCLPRGWHRTSIHLLSFTYLRSSGRGQRSMKETQMPPQWYHVAYSGGCQDVPRSERMYSLSNRFWIWLSFFF